MALRFYNEFKSARNNTYRIELWDADFSGTAVAFVSGGTGFALRRAGSGSTRVQDIVGSELIFEMDIAESEHLDFVSDMVSAREGRFTVMVLRTPAAGGGAARFWCGTVVSDIVRYPDASPFFFEVRATDGLGVLKTVDYDSSGAPYTGFETLVQIVMRCLTKLNQVTVHYSATDGLLDTSIDWWEQNMTPSSTADPLSLTFANNDVFVKREARGERTPMSCYDVLQHVCKVFGARILQTGGRFRLEQISYRANPAGFYRRRYATNGSFLGSVADTGVNVINQTVNGALLATGIYEFFPPLRKSTVLFDTGSRRNLIESYNFDETHTESDFYQKIEANGGQTTLRWSGGINLQITNTGYTGPTYEALLFVFQLKLRIGDDVLLRQYTISNVQIQYTPTENGEWVDFASNPTASAAKLLPVFPIPTTGNTSSYLVATDFTTPPLNLDGDDYTVGFELVAIEKYDGTSVFLGDFDYTYSINNNWLEVMSYGQPSLTETHEEYNTFNTVDGNTATEEIKVIMGDADNPNALGALRYLSGGVYYRTSFWGQGSGTPNLKIGQLLSKLIMSGQAVPTRRLGGTLYGDLDLNAVISWKSTNWLMLDGTYVASNDETNGNWVELIYTPGLSPSPVKKKVLQIGSTGGSPNPGGTNNGPQSQTDQQISLPPPTILTGLADNSLDLALLSGSSSSLSVATALGAGEYIAGDEIAVVHPLTGQTEIVTVTADTTAGATSIAVSGTLNGNYPAGTKMFKRRQSGYQLNDRVRQVVTGVGSSITVTAPPSRQPRRAEHVTLVVGRLAYTATEGDFTISRTSTDFTLGSINSDCSGLNGYVEWFY